MMRSLRSGSLFLLVLLGGCRSHYHFLEPEPSNHVSVIPRKDKLQKELYRCTVDGRFLFRKFHLSGLLLFKKLDDGSTRVVFQNELGFSFFDFGWTSTDSFSVNHIIKQLDKPAVVKTLRKDIELLLFKNLNRRSEFSFGEKDTHRHFKGMTHYAARWHRFTLSRGYAFYAEHNNGVQFIETTGGKKPVTSIYLAPPMRDGALPDSISVKHHRAHFTITARKITDAVTE